MEMNTNRQGQNRPTDPLHTSGKVQYVQHFLTSHWRCVWRLSEAHLDCDACGWQPGEAALNNGARVGPVISPGHAGHKRSGLVVTACSSTIATAELGPTFKSNWKCHSFFFSISHPLSLQVQPVNFSKKFGGWCDSFHSERVPLAPREHSSPLPYAISED